MAGAKRRQANSAKTDSQKRLETDSPKSASGGGTEGGAILRTEIAAIFAIFAMPIADPRNR